LVNGHPVVDLLFEVIEPAHLAWGEDEGRSGTCLANTCEQCYALILTRQQSHEWTFLVPLIRVWYSRFHSSAWLPPVWMRTTSHTRVPPSWGWVNFSLAVLRSILTCY